MGCSGPPGELRRLKRIGEASSPPDRSRYRPRAAAYRRQQLSRRSNHRPPSALLPAEGAMVPRHFRLSGGGPGSGCAGDKQGSPAPAGAAPQGPAGADSAALQPARTQAAPVPSGRQLGPRSPASGAAPCPAASLPRPALQQVGGHRLTAAAPARKRTSLCLGRLLSAAHER